FQKFEEGTRLEGRASPHQERRAVIRGSGRHVGVPVRGRVLERRRSEPSRAADQALIPYEPFRPVRASRRQGKGEKNRGEASQERTHWAIKIIPCRYEC